MNSVYYDDVHRGRVAGPIGGFHSNERGRLQRFHRYLQRNRTAYRRNGADRDERAASGSFTVTIAPGTVPLSPTGLTATGTLQNVTVTDTRNFYPGWAVYGQEVNFVGSGTAAGSTISGTNSAGPQHSG